MSDLRAMPTEYLVPILLELEKHRIGATELDIKWLENLDDNESISLQQLDELVSKAIDISNDKAFGINIGKELNISKHGYLGYAAMSSPNIEEAIKKTFQYQEIRTEAVQMSLAVTELGGEVILECDAKSAVLKRYLSEVGIYVCLDAIRLCLGGTVRGFKFEFAYDEPDYSEKYLTAFPGKISFNKKDTKIIIPSKVLSFPISSSDKPLADMIEMQCRELLESIKNNGSLKNKIKKILINSREGFLNQEEVSRCLHLTPRTLRNKLKLEGTTFREITENARFELAKSYLGNTSIKIDQIAYLLDYNEPTHFIRAFKRWSGITPSKYRVEKQKELAQRTS